MIAYFSCRLKDGVLTSRRKGRLEESHGERVIFPINSTTHKKREARFVQLRESTISKRRRGKHVVSGRVFLAVLVGVLIALGRLLARLERGRTMFSYGYQTRIEIEMIRYR